MEWYIIVIIIESVVLAGLAIALAAVCIRNKNRDTKDVKADNVKVVDGVRYTTDKKEMNDDGSAAITHLIGDFILERGITYTSRKNSRLLPGKYTIVSGVEGVEKFNVRIGGIVREIKHASDIVLAEGDEICAVSHPAILR